jgi:hypothetical protein
MQERERVIERECVCLCVCMCVGERETEKVRETEMKPHCIINYRLTVPDFRVPSLTQFWEGEKE